jgi:cytoskeleton protein RodZ
MAGNGPVRAAAGATFGDELRREREIRGISLKEIAEATKVSQRLLEAIEKDDYRYLPAPVFTRGFVREYARYLGLDDDEMVSRYIHFTHTLDVPAVTGQPEPLHSDRITAEIPIPRPYARVDRRIWALLLLLAICIGALFAFRAWVARRDAAAASRQIPARSESAPHVIPPSAEPAPIPVSTDPEQDTTAIPSVVAGHSEYDADSPARPPDPAARS